MTIRISSVEDLVYLARLRTTAGAEAKVGAPITKPLDSVEDLARIGEGCSALELVCEILRKYGIRLERTEFDSIESLAMDVGLAPHYRESLADLVSDEARLITGNRLHLR